MCDWPQLLTSLISCPWKSLFTMSGSAKWLGEADCIERWDEACDVEGAGHTAAGLGNIRNNSPSTLSSNSLKMEIIFHGPIFLWYNGTERVNNLQDKLQFPNSKPNGWSSQKSPSQTSWKQHNFFHGSLWTTGNVRIYSSHFSESHLKYFSKTEFGSLE